MDLSFVKKLVKLVENSQIDEIEIEEEGKKLKVSKGRNTTHIMQAPQPQIYSPQPATPSVTAPEPGSAAPPPAPAKKPEEKYHEIRSPIVGTFYRAPSPDADPYVEVGHTVKQGDVLCIVEAMKLMNEIESDVTGEIVKIMIENAKPVEYNQVLFLVKPS